MKKLILRFLIVGGSAAIVQLSLLFILHSILDIHSVVSSTIAFIVSVFFNFGFQKFWSFQDPDKTKIVNQFSFFLLNAIGNLIINTGIMYLLVSRFNTYISQAFVLGFIAIFNFFVYKIIFNYKKNHPAASHVQPGGESVDH